MCIRDSSGAASVEDDVGPEFGCADAAEGHIEADDHRDLVREISGPRYHFYFSVTPVDGFQLHNPVVWFTEPP